MADLKVVLDISDDARLRRRARMTMGKAATRRAPAPKRAEPPAARRSIAEEVREQVWQRDGGRCVKCGSQENLAFDHIISLSRGGSNSARNIQLVCEECSRHSAEIF
jgi:5-methylcytosine-specific restriction endonuclease McrA